MEFRFYNSKLFKSWNQY